MKKILLLLATVSLLSLGAQAATRVRSDLDPTTNIALITLSPTYCHSDGSTNDDFLTLAAGVRRLSPLQSSTSLNISYGGDLEWLMYTGKNAGSQNLIGIKVPFSFVYRYDMSDEISFFPYLGLHLAGYLFGKAKSPLGTEINVFNEDDMWPLDPYNRFLLGGQLGVKACYENIFFGVGYERTLTTLMPDTAVGRINFSVGFAF